MPTSFPEHIQTEATGIIHAFDSNPGQVIGLMERQLNAVHTRAQIVIGFAAVAVTTTGFSGRLIAGTNTTAQIAIIAGLTFILSSCLWLLLKVLSVEWVISRYLSDNLLASVCRILAYRDKKTRAYRRGCVGIMIGLAIYGISIAIMLLNPEPITVPVR